jgi:signal peptidase I
MAGPVGAEEEAVRVRSRLPQWRGLGVLALGLVTLLPRQVGGSVDYVVTHGVSMLPRFHTGDPAIVQGADSYQVGQVVAYHCATLRTTCMHRIVARGGNRLVFKGDNNSWLNPDKPTQSQLIGPLWVRVPQGGRLPDFLHAPSTLAAMTLGLLLGSKRRRPRRTLRRIHVAGTTG